MPHEMHEVLFVRMLASIASHKIHGFLSKKGCTVSQQYHVGLDFEAELAELVIEAANEAGDYLER